MGNRCCYGHLTLLDKCVILDVRSFNTLVWTTTWGLGFKSKYRQNTRWFLPICYSLVTWYKLLVGGDMYPVELVELCTIWPGHKPTTNVCRPRTFHFNGILAARAFPPITSTVPKCPIPWVTGTADPTYKNPRTSYEPGLIIFAFPPCISSHRKQRDQVVIFYQIDADAPDGYKKYMSLNSNLSIICPLDQFEVLVCRAYIGTHL